MNVLPSKDLKDTLACLNLAGYTGRLAVSCYHKSATRWSETVKAGYRHPLVLDLYNDVLSYRIGSYTNRVRSGMKQHLVSEPMLEGVRNRERSRVRNRVLMFSFCRRLPLFILTSLLLPAHQYPA